MSALGIAQTAAAAAVAAPGAATAATLAAAMAAVEEAINEEEKAEEEEQNQSSENASHASTKSQITSASAPSSISSSSSVSSSASCSASGTGSICSSALIPVYTLDADTFANVQDVLDAAQISSRLAPIMAEGAGSASQSSLSSTISGPASFTTSPSTSTAGTSSTTSTPTLNCQQNIPSDGPAPSDIANALTTANGVATVCAGKFDGSGDSTHMTFNHGFIDIELIRSSDTQTLTHCNDAINSIISTCILGSADYGGIYSQDGQTYNITNTIAPANPLIPGTDPGAPSTTAALPTTSSVPPPPPAPTTTAPSGPPTPSQISSNNHGSALCHSLAGACKIAYTGYNDTWLYTHYSSYPADPGDADTVNWLFAPFANDGCAAMFTCDNNDAYSVGMLGSQIKAA